jgi:hypothetical protein
MIPRERCAYSAIVAMGREMSQNSHCKVYIPGMPRQNSP